ncbi:MAG: alpha/beta hydrolase [Hyphomicrobiales bacterium]|nr:alpha/beta hydrolase [Hyphomicrobiales bacterium]
MSEAEVDEQQYVEVAGASDESDPAIALQDALSQAGAALAAAKVGPQFLREMIWAAPDPAAIHPSRPAIDKVWREVFGGFRPPVEVRLSPDEYTHVMARATPPESAPSASPVYQSYNVMELAQQMSPRNQVPDMIAEFRKWTREGDAARANLRGLDIAYGPGRANMLDLYRPEGVAEPPVWVFIHGGYWQASSKDQHAQFCKGMLEAGFAVANIDYALAPETPLGDIVGEIRMALNFIASEAGNLGVNGDELHICGHSAGGHLTAYAAADKDCPKIASALPLSGIFDLEALRLIPMGKVLGLNTPEQARALSPLFMPKPQDMRIRIALGGLESDEFKRQSAELARAWGAPTPLHVDGANHFSLLDHLNGGALLELALDAARG